MIGIIDEKIDVVTVQLGGELMAIPASGLREILEPVPVTRVPQADAFVSGLINVRGAVVPLADLRVAFGMQPKPATPDTRILVLEVPFMGETVTVAITADKVHEVTWLSRADIEEIPTVGTRWPPEFVLGIGKRDDAFLILPDLQRIFRTHGAEGAESRKDQVT